MIRTLTTKLAVLMVAFAGLAGTALAQPGFGGTYGQPQVSDEALDRLFREVDPNVHVTVSPDGSRDYLFRVRRASGVVLPLGVRVAAGRLTMVATVSERFTPQVSVDEINARLRELNYRLAPTRVMAQATEDGRAVFLAGINIDRSLSVKQMAEQIDGFFRIAEAVRARLGAHQSG